MSRAACWRDRAKRTRPIAIDFTCFSSAGHQFSRLCSVVLEEPVRCSQKKQIVRRLEGVVELDGRNNTKQHVPFLDASSECTMGRVIVYED